MKKLDKKEMALLAMANASKELNIDTINNLSADTINNLERAEALEEARLDESRGN
jgi:hypothetical protein